MIVGYKLIDDANGNVVSQWGGQYGRTPAFPNPIILPNGDQICGGDKSTSYGGFTVVPWEMERPPQTVFDGASFIMRLTDDEYAAITSSQIVQIRRWVDIFRLKGEIDVSGSTALAAKAGLVSAGLLTNERAEIIFATA